MAAKNIKSDDLILVNRGGVDYRAKVSDLGGGGLDCAGLLDCLNAAPVDAMRFALALSVHERWFLDPNDQPDWPEDQQEHAFYMYADLCDPVTHEIIPFDQEGHGHSGDDGSIFRLPHGYYVDNYCVITACPPTQHLEDKEVVYGVHPPKLLLEDLKVFTGRYEKGTTTTEDLFTTGTEVDGSAVSENGEKIYLSLPKCDSFGDPPNNWEGQRCLEDDFEDGGNYFFRLEFMYNNDPQKLTIILNHDRSEGRPPPGNSVTYLVNEEMPNIQIKPMEDN